MQFRRRRFVLAEFRVRMGRLGNEERSGKAIFWFHPANLYYPMIDCALHDIL